MASERSSSALADECVAWKEVKKRWREAEAAAEVESSKPVSLQTDGGERKERGERRQLVDVGKGGGLQYVSVILLTIFVRSADVGVGGGRC